MLISEKEKKSEEEQISENRQKFKSFQLSIVKPLTTDMRLVCRGKHGKVIGRAVVPQHSRLDDSGTRHDSRLRVDQRHERRRRSGRHGHLLEALRRAGRRRGGGPAAAAQGRLRLLLGRDRQRAVLALLRRLERGRRARRFYVGRLVVLGHRRHVLKKKKKQLYNEIWQYCMVLLTQLKQTNLATISVSNKAIWQQLQCKMIQIKLKA